MTTGMATATRADRAGEVVLAVSDLSVSFPTPDGLVRAVRGVSLTLRRGEVLGIVGESGSGKSVTATAIMGLLPPSAVVSGSILLDGTEMVGTSDRRLSTLRGSKIAMIFQDPLSALTPVYTIGQQIAETVVAHRRVSRAEARARAIELLAMVGIPEPERRIDSYPHEFSGGMRQRAMIAMAIANDPDVIIADEPTTALDVTIQAQVIAVLRRAQQETGAALVFVSHDLGVIAGFADRVAVMYAGRVVESAPIDELFARPRMPYTLGLIGAVPRLDTRSDSALVPIPGTPPSMLNYAGGCPFADRCPLVIPACRTAEPPLLALPSELLPSELRASELRPEPGPALSGKSDAPGRAGLLPLTDVPGPSALSGLSAPSGLSDQPDAHTAACIRSAEIVAQGSTPRDIFDVPDIELPPIAAVPRAEREVVLETRGLTTTFPLVSGGVFKRRTGTVWAVDGVDLEIRAGEILGLVGESGSGKSTTLHGIMSLALPESGTVELFGQQLGALTGGADGRKALRSAISMVFQDPMASLDPRMPVTDIVAEPLRATGSTTEDVDRRVPELMRLVGLDPDDGSRFPHEFSGGQRQRISIARALAVNPRLLVLDEPVSALDVSIQAGVLNLLGELRAKLGLSYLFVSHDLSVIRHIADRVSVMYLGRTVETGSVDEIFEHPLHPYTQALLSAVPIPDPVRERAREHILLPGDPPSPTVRQTGCRFRGRCPVFAQLDPRRQQACIDVVPEQEPHGREGLDHVAACHWPVEKKVA